MPGSLSALAAAAQNLRAQSLSTLMSAMDSITPVSGVTANAADNPQASLQSAEAQVKATLVSVDAQGKAIVDIAGSRVEAQLPRALLDAARTNPDLLRPGSALKLPADVPARLLEPATRVDVHGMATGTALGAPPLLASPFPPGSLGAAVARLAGLALPGAEAEASLTPGALPAPAPHAPTLRPGLITQGVQPEILTALVQAAGRQVPLAQGLSALLALPPEALASLPPQVQAVLAKLAATRSAPAQLASAEGLQQAVAQSGTFLEARLAAGQAAPQNDLKALLLALKSLVGAPPALPNAPSGTGGLSHAAALLLNDAEMNGQAPGAGTARTAPPALAEVQRAVDGALERIKLTQIASLPDHAEMRVTDDRAQPMRVAVSLPLATQGPDRPPTAVLGLVIEHRPAPEKPPQYEVEEEGESPEVAGFPWKVRIALDLEETGPVQAEIALRGQSVGVTVWAERASMAQAARHQIGDLHKALTQAAFDVVTLDVKDGVPRHRAMAHAPLLDRRS